MASVAKAIVEEAEAYPHAQRAQADASAAVSRTSYARYMEESFFYAAVFAIMAAGASAPWVWRRQTKDEDGKVQYKEIEHPILDRIMRRPNPYMTWYDLMESVYAYLELSGKNYWEIAEDGRGETKRLALYPIRPDMLSARGNERELISHYVFRDPHTSQERDIPANLIVRFAYFHPASFRDGLGSAEPCLDAAETIIRASKFNHKFFTDSAVPEGALSTDQKLNTRETTQIWQMWMNRHAGENRQRLPAVLHSGLKWSPLGIGHKDMDFRELIDQGREDILAATGVPPILVGWLKYVNYNTAAVQERSFWVNTMAPKLKKVEAAIDLYLVPILRVATGIDDLVGYYDLSAIPAMQEDADDLADRVGKLYQLGLITRNEARQQLEYDPDEEHGDEYYSPLGAMGGGISEAESTEKAAPKMSPKAAKIARKAMASLSNLRERRVAALYPQVSRFYREQGEAVIKAFERMAAKKSAEWTTKSADDRAALLRLASEIDQASPRAEPRRADDPLWVEIAKYEVEWDDLMDDIGEEEAKKLAKILAAAGLQTMRQGGVTVLVDALGKDAGEFAISEAIAQDFVEHSLAAAGGAVDTARQRVVRDLAKGIAEGETSASLARRIRDTYQGLSVEHSAMIAQTEAQGAMNYGALEGYVFAGIEKKAWMTSPGENRPGHAMIDGQIRATGEPFDVPLTDKEGSVIAVEQLMYPGDYAGSFANTHNCACTLVPIVEED